MRVRVAELGAHVGEEVEVAGWLAGARSSGSIHFLQVRDGTGLVQAVVSKTDVGAEEFQAADRLPHESSLVVRGILRADRRAPGGVELGARALRVVSRAQAFPITPKEHGIEFLMDRRHLWLRSGRQAAILRVRAEIERAVEDYLRDQGYLRVDAPILTPSSVEGTGTLFETAYFDLGSAYLTQSGQLYNEAAAMALGRVYCFGPTFRAEKSKTRRHLTEFWMVEPEAAYLDLDGMIALAEGMVAFVAARVRDARAGDLATLERDPAALARITPPFPRITYDEALRVLERAGTPVRWGDDFGGDEETVISKSFDRPVFVTHYPAAVKAFYMQPDPARPEVVLGADLLAPEGYGEIIGGGERIRDLALLEQRIAGHGLPREHYEWYLDLRRYGSVPHSGFGLGIERTVAWLCGLDHVRETIPFPRLLNRITP